MTAPSLETLLAVATEEDVVADELAVLQATPTPFDVTSWAITSVPRVLLAAFARAAQKLYALIPKIAAGGYVKLAKGDWLTLLSSENFNEERDTATFAERVIRVTDAGGAPVSFPAGALVMETSTKLLFTSKLNPDGSTPALAASSYVDVYFTAAAAGTAYNGAAGTWRQVTAIPGLTFADAPAGVTVPGTEDEPDESLANDDAAKWSTLGSGANDAAHIYNAKHAPGLDGDEVTRVKVRRHTPLPGQVTLIVAGPTSSGADGADALASDIVDAIQEYIDPPSHLGKAPTAVDVFIESAKVKVITITGTVTAISTEKAYAQALAETALNAWAAAAPLGAKISREKLIGKIMAGLSDEDGNDATITTPAADVVLAANEVPVFNFVGLTWVDA